jgi:exosome complex component RRP42
LFEPGPPREEAIELARVVDRGIRESKVIKTEELCLIKGRKVLIVFIDVYVLNHDGNLIDASAIAALAALMNTKIANYEVTEEEVQVKPGYNQLPIQNYPIAITFAKINGKLAVDPGLKEEQAMDTRLTITIEKEGKICAIQKAGAGILTEEQIAEAAKLAKTKAAEIRKSVVKE